MKNIACQLLLSAFPYRTNFEKMRLSFIKYLFSSFPGAYNVQNLTREISKIDPSRFQLVTITNSIAYKNI